MPQHFRTFGRRSNEDFIETNISPVVASSPEEAADIYFQRRQAECDENPGWLFLPEIMVLGVGEPYRDRPQFFRYDPRPRCTEFVPGGPQDGLDKASQSASLIDLPGV